MYIIFATCLVLKTLGYKIGWYFWVVAILEICSKHGLSVQLENKKEREEQDGIL